MINFIRSHVLAVALVAFFAGQFPVAADEFSEAEKRLWLTDHLAAIESAMTLSYTFRKTGTLEEGFDDDIALDIKSVNADGSKVASFRFFSGERRIPVPDTDRATENPVLETYLYGDVREMNRLTDDRGVARERWRYFQRRIRLAAANDATVEPIRFRFDGQDWDGHHIHFRPYHNDPKRNFFEQLAEKQYSFIVSDSLPGYFFRIETVVPAEGGSDAEPLLKETIQLQAVARGNS